MSDEPATEHRMEDILVQEYLQLQKTIEEFDGKALTIKAWSVTLSAAGIVTAYVEEKPAILLIAAASALVFWIVEALWKTNQQAFYERVYEIEGYFAESDSPVRPLRIAGAWSESWHCRSGGLFALTVMWWLHVMIPHAVVAAAGVVLFFVAPPGVRC